METSCAECSLLWRVREKVVKAVLRLIGSFWHSIISSPKDLYSHADLRGIINEYTTSHSLVNSNDQQYIHPDDLLISVFTAPKSDESILYLKRDEAVKRLISKMQDWHEIIVEGKDPIIKSDFLSLYRFILTLTTVII